MSPMNWLLSVGAVAAIIELLWWTGVGIYLYRFMNKDGDEQ